ncbi:ABC transporter ATP-binding protein [bacterium]|nr:ABC transporter ATP-binding protein [bacterium]
MIELDGVVASYRTGFTRRRRVVLDGIGFRIPKGAIAGYLGVNGAGKTTTIKLIVGINSPDAGRIATGTFPAGSRESKATLGYLPENPYFYEYLTPLEALEFYGRLSGVPRAERRTRAEKVLAEVDLRYAASQAVREFSKGMRQRLGLAQALIHSPELLVLDEPLTGLDPMGRKLLRADEGPFRVAFEGVPEEKLARIGEAAGAKVERRGARHEVQTRDRSSAERALVEVQAAGGKLEVFQPVGVTLEDYFLKTYGRSRLPPDEKPGGSAAP